MKLLFSNVVRFFLRGFLKVMEKTKQGQIINKLDDAHIFRQPHQDGQDVDARNERGLSRGTLTKEQKNRKMPNGVRRTKDASSVKSEMTQSWIFVGRLQMVLYVSSVWGMRVFVFLCCKIFLSDAHEIFVYLAAKAQTFLNHFSCPTLLPSLQTPQH